MQHRHSTTERNTSKSSYILHQQSKAVKRKLEAQRGEGSRGKQDMIVLYIPNDVKKLFCLHLISLYPPSQALNLIYHCVAELSGAQVTLSYIFVQEQ